LNGPDDRWWRNATPEKMVAKKLTAGRVLRISFGPAVFSVRPGGRRTVSGWGVRQNAGRQVVVASWWRRLDVIADVIVLLLLLVVVWRAAVARSEDVSDTEWRQSLRPVDSSSTLLHRASVTVSDQWPRGRVDVVDVCCRQTTLDATVSPASPRVPDISCTVAHAVDQSSLTVQTHRHDSLVILHAQHCEIGVSTSNKQSLYFKMCSAFREQNSDKLSVALLQVVDQSASSTDRMWACAVSVGWEL